MKGLLIGDVVALFCIWAYGFAVTLTACAFGAGYVLPAWVVSVMWPITIPCLALGRFIGSRSK